MSTTRSDQIRQLADFLDEHPDLIATFTIDGRALGIHVRTPQNGVDVLHALGPAGWQPRESSVAPGLDHDEPLLGFPAAHLYTPSVPVPASTIPAEILAVLA